VFDEVAEIYDTTFTSSKIGKLLRNVIWQYLDQVLSGDTSLKILELNCGTGEDAIYLASKGHHVMATDISEQMVNVAKEKVKESGFEDKIEVRQCDAREVDDCQFQSGFDLIFSNFGGLNCLSREELGKLSCDLYHLLKPSGRFIVVIMPKFCVWESLYFTFKGKKSEIFRRNTDQSLQVKVGNSFVETWYYSPNDITHILENYFEKLATKPVGISLPPSYMEPFFENKKDLLKIFNGGENLLNKVSLLSACSDHFLIDLVKNQVK